jgi:hypothetical protein
MFHLFLLDQCAVSAGLRANGLDCATKVVLPNFEKPITRKTILAPARQTGRYALQYGVFLF